MDVQSIQKRRGHIYSGETHVNKTDNILSCKGALS